MRRYATRHSISYSHGKKKVSLLNGFKCCVAEKTCHKSPRAGGVSAAAPCRYWAAARLLGLLPSAVLVYILFKQQLSSHLQMKSSVKIRDRQQLSALRPQVQPFSASARPPSKRLQFIFFWGAAFLPLGKQWSLIDVPSKRLCLLRLFSLKNPGRMPSYCCFTPL